MTKVLFIHGKESGPHGSKYHALVKAGFDVIAPDLQGMDLRRRVLAIIPIIKEHHPFIVGSSLGGVTAILAAMSAREELPGLVLCAPRLTWYPHSWRSRLEQLHVENTPITIVHGLHDSIVPDSFSREYAWIHKSKFVEVNDDHRLSNSVDVIVDELKSMISAT